MKIFATKRYSFSAAHQLSIPHMSAEETEKLHHSAKVIRDAAAQIGV